MRPSSETNRRIDVKMPFVSQTTLNLFKLSLILGVSLIIAGCNFPIEKDPNPILPQPTIPPLSNSGSISGIVWHDLCDNSTGFGVQPEGCVKADSESFYYANGILEAGEPRIEGIEVSLGQGICPAKGLVITHTNAEGKYHFSELEPGVYCVSMHESTPHLAKLEPGMWTYPKADGGQGVGWITITLKAGDLIEEVNFGWDFLEQPTRAVPEPTNTPSSEPVCRDHTTFVQDVTIPDGTSIEAGKSFEKTWRLKNTGTCTWTTAYSLVFHGGDLLGHVEQESLSRKVMPGESIDLTVELVASQTSGAYESYWMLQSAKGEKFGIGEDGDKPFWVKVNVGITPSPTAVVSWTPRLDPGEMAGEGRWVDVDLGDQLLTAYEGSTPIMTFLVSTGTAAHPTVTGQFRIWTKLESTRMRGPGYDLEDVPYTMYFYEGYGLHGAYWHNNFGTPMSHGCVNLSPSNAGWLFNFASVGTLVNIHS